jgi:hypothetical protein
MSERNEIKYLNVRFEDDYYSDMEPEPEPEPEPEEQEDDTKNEVKPLGRGAPKTPTPSIKSPESIHNSQVTLNVTSDGEMSNYFKFYSYN